MVFPGQNYALYPHFVTGSRIFPQLPGLDLIPKRHMAEQPDLDAKLLRSRAIGAWYAGGQKDDTRPSRQLSDYRDRRTPKWLPNTRGVLIGFFDRAKKGDLVLVPPSSVFSRVLIGELLDDPADFEEFMIPEIWGREKVPSRRVRWLATPLRGECSIELQKRFPSPNAVRILDREARGEVYSLAYGSYSIDDSFTCKFDVTSADFSTKDDYYIQQIFNSVAAICQRIETEQNPKLGFNPKDWDDIIALLTDAAYIPDLAVSINSPGSLTLSCRKLVPLIAAALFALATLGADATWQAINADELKITNSAAPAEDPCSAKVDEDVRKEIDLMGYERWVEMCKKLQALRESTGLKSKSTVQKKK